MNILRLSLLLDEIREGLLNSSVMEKIAKRLCCNGVEHETIGCNGVETQIGRARLANVDATGFEDKVNPHMQYMITM